MNQLDIFCFTSSARTLSFSITARELMISQQAVSRHIKNLEDEIGYPLFFRNFQNLVLTKAGERLLAYFEEHDRLRDDFRRETDSLLPKNLLKIGWLQWLSCPEWFHILLRRFQEQYPDVNILFYDLDARELDEAQRAGELDFILTTRYSSRYLPVAWNYLVWREQPIIILGNAESPLETEHTVWAVDGGEFQEETIRARTLRLCGKVGIRNPHILILPDMGSACLNILSAGGIVFGTKLSILDTSEDLSITETSQTATAVLGFPFYSVKPSAKLFDGFIRSEYERSFGGGEL